MKRLVLVLLGLVIVFGTINLYRLYQDSSSTPDDAVSKYISRVTQNTPHTVESVTVVSTTPFGETDSALVLLFRAAEQSTNIHVAGYAIVKKTLFGWSVDKLQMTGKSPLPDDILANLDWTDSGPVIYGQAFLADITTIQAVFADPNTGQMQVSTPVPVGNFVLFGPRYGELMEVRLLDDTGNVLKRFTREALQNK